MLELADVAGPGVGDELLGGFRREPEDALAGARGDAVAAYEKDLIQDALKTTRGNRAKAARLLDTTERIVNYKVRRYGIDARRFKS